MQFVCTNCGHRLNELYHYSSSTVKTKTCDNCHQIADKYIEFEVIFVLVDALLLSQSVYRHMLYNRSFKLHWKLSLVLLLLESFALWRKRRVQIGPDAESFAPKNEMIRERGFYICCLQNILDYVLLTTLLLLTILILHDWTARKIHIRKEISLLLKAVAIANFSKFFLLPDLVWRENTTEFGSVLHQLLVLGHHLCALVNSFIVVYTTSTISQPPKRQLNKFQVALIILLIYCLKEYLKSRTSLYVDILL